MNQAIQIIQENKLFFATFFIASIILNLLIQRYFTKSQDKILKEITNDELLKELRRRIKEKELKITVAEFIKMTI